MLLSVINTKLRDVYPNLERLCDDLGQDETYIRKQLETIDYAYDEIQNQFV